MACREGCKFRENAMADEDLSSLSEITILPDGRVYLFGATRPLLEILESLGGKDERIEQLLRTLRNQDAPVAANPHASAATVSTRASEDSSP